MIFHQLNITLEFPAEADHWAVYVQMWMGVFVTYLNFANVSENDSVPNT